MPADMGMCRHARKDEDVIAKLLAKSREDASGGCSGGARNKEECSRRHRIVAIQPSSQLGSANDWWQTLQTTAVEIALSSLSAAWKDVSVDSHRRW